MTHAMKFDASLLCRASFPAELEDDGGLRPACYLDSDLLISVDSEDTGIGPQEAGTIVAELVEQFGGSYATGEQFAAEVSFLLGKLRAIREKEAAHE